MASTAIVTIGRLAGGLLLLGHFDYFTSVILPAMGTDTVRQAIFVARRAFGKRRPLQVIVRASLSPPRIRMSSFWIRHSSIRLILFERRARPASTNSLALPNDRRPVWLGMRTALHCDWRHKPDRSPCSPRCRSF